MTTRKRSERSRWTTVFVLPEPSVGELVDYSVTARENHRKALAVVKAFEAVGRVVRVESAQYGSAIVLRARKS